MTAVKKDSKAPAQTAHYLQRPNIELLDKIQQLKDELVKISHQDDPDLRFHRFLNTLEKSTASDPAALKITDTLRIIKTTGYFYS